MSLWLVHFTLIAMLLLPSDRLWAEEGHKVGAVAGEMLRYNIHWLGVPSGKAIMRVAEPRHGDFELTATLESIGAAHLIYPVRDVLTATGIRHQGGLAARNYIKEQKEGRGGKRRSAYLFDREWGTIHYTFNQESPQEMTAICPEVNDPLSSLYLVRQMAHLHPGMQVELPLVDGEKQYRALLLVGETQKLFTPLGWFQALPLYPQLASSELFRHQGNLTIWLTEDERHLPLRVEAKMKIGAVAADLIAFDDGRGQKMEMKLERER